MRQNLAAFHPLPALYPVPALVAILAAGLAAGQPGAALLAAAGAFSTGFGAFQRVSRFAIAPMLLAAICMAAATFIGTVLSAGHTGLYVALVGVGAALLGLAASFGTGPWWVLLQGAIFMLISGARPAGPEEALLRAGIVLGGGVVQGLTVWMLRSLFPRGFPPISAPNAVEAPASPAEWRAKAREVFRPDAPEVRYAVLLGLTTALAMIAGRRLVGDHGYWVGLTVLLILRRGGTETVVRGVQRMGGTMLGAGAATLLVSLLRPELAATVALLTLSAWCAYAMQWVNYGTFSASVTSYIAFLFALEGSPEPKVAADRVLATVIGGALGLAALGLARLGSRAARLSR